ncbi:sigma54 specific transcriptional regulator, Fis family [Magnetococcus marinus MC-1]|uniref:Sigma54 specific transcriptional regulator, Fis family n=1 Tax=Magnetococcus marinus (strain ATCC BAA-1437 / JCM 17883 / MC-1) TaxID=156889 RepID=A0L881_MAGMM|nr:sigma-54 dependent transcriptional regulator [Magnetococcus marinus]ABK44174.1 sigma54 specific transcriptional regulator, Fis family [Magnetococcus marinus MC-1]
MSVTPRPEHLESLFYQTDPATLLDANYHILATNLAYRTAFHQGHEVAGRACYDVSHGFNRPCDEVGECCPLKLSIQSGVRSTMLHVHHLAHGKEYVRVEIEPIFDGAESALYYKEVLRRTFIASAEPKAHGLVGTSHAFINLLEKVHQVAPESVPVLLTGESGTGKELIARAVHDASNRANGPFVPVECSGLTETLFESELFGHRKGAFTGALSDKQGLVEAARGGTLFLDEIGDVPLLQQVKLLRLLESHTFRKVGETEVKKADFRLVCATNRNLDERMAQGLFRRDLYYRISTFPIKLPALRERRQDIGLLAHSILMRVAPERKLRLSQGAEQLLKNYAFPGNIRELLNLLERARILSSENQLSTHHFPALCHETTATDAAPTIHPHFVPPEDKILSLKALEQRYLSFLLERHTGNQEYLAQALGVSLRTLTRKIAALKRSTGRATPEAGSLKSGQDRLVCERSS